MKWKQNTWKAAEDVVLDGLEAGCGMEADHGMDVDHEMEAEHMEGGGGCGANGLEAGCGMEADHGMDVDHEMEAEHMEGGGGCGTDGLEAGCGMEADHGMDVDQNGSRTWKAEVIIPTMMIQNQALHQKVEKMNNLVEVMNYL